MNEKFSLFINYSFFCVSPVFSTKFVHNELKIFFTIYKMKENECKTLRLFSDMRSYVQMFTKSYVMEKFRDTRLIQHSKYCINSKASAIKT